MADEQLPEDETPIEPQNEAELPEEEGVHQNGAAPRRQPAASSYEHFGQEKITRTMVVPRRVSEFDPSFKRPAAPILPRKEEQVSVKDARAFLDELQTNPDSIDYKLVCYRVKPVHINGTSVPSGPLLESMVVGFDDLRQLIIDAWGGEKWRIMVKDSQGRPAGFKSIFIDIDPQMYPPKLKKFAVTIDPETTPPEEMTPEDLDFRERQRAIESQIRLENQEQKLAESTRRREANERKSRIDALIAAKTERELLGIGDENKPNAALQIMEARLASMEKATEATNRMFMDALGKLGDSISKVAEIAARPAPPPPPDNGLKDIVVALISSNANKPPDNSRAELIEVMKSNNDMVLRATGKDNGQQAQLLNGLLTALINKGQGSELTPDTMIKLIGMGQKQVSDTMQMMQPAGGGEDSYQPELGLWGNLQRALVEGVKHLPALAAQNPMILQKAMSLFGTVNPSEAQAQMAAQQLQGQDMPPPPLLPQPQQFSTGPGPDQFQVAVHQSQGFMVPPVQQQPVQQRQPQQPITPPQPPPLPPQQFQVEAPVPLDASPMPQPLQQALVENPPDEPTPEERLFDAVSESMTQCLHGIQDNTEKRDWWQNAHDFWPASFKKALVQYHTAEERMVLIRRFCEPTVWVRLIKACDPRQGGNMEELIRFHDDLKRLVELNKSLVQPAQPAQAPVAAQPAPQPPAPAPVQPEPQPPAAPAVQAQTEVAAAISQ